MDGLADDEPVQVAQGNFSQQFIAIGLGIASVNFEAFAAKMHADVRLVEASGGHLRVFDLRFWIFALRLALCKQAVERGDDQQLEVAHDP